MSVSIVINFYNETIYIYNLHIVLLLFTLKLNGYNNSYCSELY